VTTLYWDCSAGIAGNMAVASLLDLGVDPELLRKELAKLPFPEGKLVLHTRDIMKNGIRAKYFNTEDDEKPVHAPHPGVNGHTHCHDQQQDHDHAHDHTHCHEPGHAHAHDHAHDHGHDHPHDHKHDYDHGHDHIHDQTHDHKHGHSHAGEAPERGFREVRALIEAAGYRAGVTERALACFRALAGAEAEVHGATPDTVHFHEVGARDSIADIVGTAICLEELGVTAVHVSPVHVGRGFVRCCHGRMPVPAPATALLLRGYEMFSIPEVEGELTTPTGAALLKGLGAKNGMPAGFVAQKVGTGAGSREFPIPNILRAFLGEGRRGAMPGICEDEVVMLETNLDNATGELLGYAAERLWEIGVLDVTMSPLTMKKGRPGIALRVLTPPDLADQALALLFAELPTLGIRRQTVRRAVLHRESAEMKTSFGTVAVKNVTDPDGTVRCVPEYESLRRLAIETGTPLRDLMARMVKKISEAV